MLTPIIAVDALNGAGPLASMLNDLAGQVLTHTTQLQHLTPGQQGTRQ